MSTEENKDPLPQNPSSGEPPEVHGPGHGPGEHPDPSDAVTFAVMDTTIAGLSHEEMESVALVQAPESNLANTAREDAEGEETALPQAPEKPTPETAQESTERDKPASAEMGTPADRWQLIPIEPLGAGIVNALANAVSQVVATATSHRKTTTPQKRPAQKKKKSFFPSSSGTSSSTLGKGAKGFAASVEKITQNSINIVTGVAYCLQESFSCMGNVIMNPSKKPCRKGKTAPQATAPHVSADLSTT